MQSQQIQDVVFFYENLIYSKVYRTIFRQISQKLGIPQGGSEKHFARKRLKMVFFGHFLVLNSP